MTGSWLFLFVNGKKSDTYGYLLIPLKKGRLTDVFISLSYLMTTGATRLIQLAIIQIPTLPIALSVPALPFLHHSASDPVPAGAGSGNLGYLKLPVTARLASAILLRQIVLTS